MVNKELNQKILLLGLTTLLVGSLVFNNFGVVKAHWGENDSNEQEQEQQNGMGMQFGFGAQNNEGEHEGNGNSGNKPMRMMQNMQDNMQQGMRQGMQKGMQQGENGKEMKQKSGNKGSKIRALFRLETREQVREYREKLREQEAQYRKVYRQKVRAEMKEEIQKQCGNIKDKEQRRACVQKIIANHIDEVAQRVAQKFDKLIEHINNSKVISADVKAKIVAKLNELKAQAQQIEEQIKSGKITAREGAKQLRELSKQAHEVVKQVRVSLTARVYKRLQRVVNITSRVYEKIKNKVSADASAQMQAIVEQLKALVGAGQPQDVSVARQEMSQIRTLVMQFVQIVKEQLHSAQNNAGQASPSTNQNVQ